MGELKGMPLTSIEVQLITAPSHSNETKTYHFIIHDSYIHHKTTNLQPLQIEFRGKMEIWNEHTTTVIKKYVVYIPSIPE